MKQLRVPLLPITGGMLIERNMDLNIVGRSLNISGLLLLISNLFYLGERWVAVNISWHPPTLIWGQALD